ncbi:hypothetical protein [Mobiluncus mulieris]|nr:hypothetical protein [Mobiluncus mulieris]
MVSTENTGSPRGTIKAPGLGVNAPKPGQVLSGEGVPGLRVPQTAHAVRAVDATGTMTGMIPVIGKAKAQSNAGPALPGVEPVVVQGNKPIIPDKPAVPVPPSRPATQISQLHSPGAPIPPSTTGMIPVVTPSSGPAPHAPGGNPKPAQVAKPASPVKPAPLQAKPGAIGVPIVTDARTGSKSHPTALVTDTKTSGSVRPVLRPAATSKLGGATANPTAPVKRPPSPVPVPGMTPVKGKVAGGNANRPAPPITPSHPPTASPTASAQVAGQSRPVSAGGSRQLPPAGQKQSGAPNGARGVASKLAPNGVSQGTPNAAAVPAGAPKTAPKMVPMGASAAKPGHPGQPGNPGQPPSNGGQPAQKATRSGQQQPESPRPRPAQSPGTQFSPTPSPAAKAQPGRQPSLQPGSNPALPRQTQGHPPGQSMSPATRPGGGVTAVSRQPEPSQDVVDLLETEARPRAGQIVHPQTQNPAFAGESAPQSPGSKPQPDLAKNGFALQRPEMPAQNPVYPGMQGIPPTPGVSGMGRYPAMPGMPMPGMPGMMGRPGAPGMPMPGTPGMPGMPMPGMPGMMGRPGFPPAGPYGWGRPRAPYGYGMPMPPRGAWGAQQTRSSRRETLENIEARQIQELKEAEEASHQAEIEALKSQAERFGSELSDEEIEDIDWDEFEETFTERLIRKSGRWGETILMVGQAARWALVVLVTVLVVVLLIFALDRSASQKSASGFSPQIFAAVEETFPVEKLLYISKNPEYQHFSIYHTGGV